MLARELGLSYQDCLELPDEVFWLYVEKCFDVLTKQVGLSATGYDFSTDEAKKKRKFFEDGIEHAASFEKNEVPQEKT